MSKKWTAEEIKKEFANFTKNVFGIELDKQETLGGKLIPGKLLRIKWKKNQDGAKYLVAVRDCDSSCGCGAPAGTKEYNFINMQNGEAWYSGYRTAEQIKQSWDNPKYRYEVSVV